MASKVAEPGLKTLESSTSSGLSSLISVRHSDPTGQPIPSDDVSDEYIVWSGSDSCVLVSPQPSDASQSSADDDDYVLLSPSTFSAARSGTNDNAHSHKRPSDSSVQSLIPAMGKLAIDGNSPKASKPRQGRQQTSTKLASKPTLPKSNGKAKPPIPKASSPTTTEHKSKPRRRSKTTVADKAHSSSHSNDSGHSENPTFRERAIVDDVSELGVESSFYESATKLMATVLSSPDPVNSLSRLQILQALVVELGLVTTEIAIPTSVSAARALLKSRVFINILDYLAVRDKGREALQQVMHKNRASLIRDLRKRKKRRASLTWAKEWGLRDLLVSCY